MSVTPEELAILNALQEITQSKLTFTQQLNAAICEKIEVKRLIVKQKRTRGMKFNWDFNRKSR